MNNIDLLIVLTLISILANAFQLFIKPYFSQKGKNLATKQDIRNITDKIEDVKSQYSKQLESTKADLQLTVHRNNLMLQKSTELLLAFYDDVMILNHDKLNKNLTDFYQDEFMKEICNYQSETEDLFKKLKLSYHRLLIFMNGEDKLMQKAVFILEITIQIKKVFTKHMPMRKIAMYKEGNASKESVGAYEDAIKFNNEITDAYHEELIPLRKQLDHHIGDFIGILMDHFERNKIELVDTVQ